jgi:dTDP-4-dehydrorhamnose reductase
MTDVDGCEKDREMAWKVNVLATENVAQACKTHGSRLVYISTDYVFDGQAGPYSETDTVSPAQYYGETKLEGEKKVYAALPDALTVRICVPYDWNTQAKPNFLMWLVSKLEAKEKVKIVTDQWNTPTCMPHAAEIMLQLLEKGAKGIFHVSGRDFLDRYDFSMQVCKVFGLDPSLMEPCTSEGFKQIAARPMRGGLKCGKAETFLSQKMLTTSEGLELVRRLRNP